MVREREHVEGSYVLNDKSLAKKLEVLCEGLWITARVDDVF